MKFASLYWEAHEPLGGEAEMRGRPPLHPCKRVTGCTCSREWYARVEGRDFNRAIFPSAADLEPVLDWDGVAFFSFLFFLPFFLSAGASQRK